MTRRHWITATGLVLLGGCSGRDAEIRTGADAAAAPIEPAAARVLSTLHMADPAAAPQLLTGFHGIEQNAWRWTERKFSISLKPPAESAARAQLRFRFAIAPAMIERLHSITLSVSTGGVLLESETYDKADEYVFTTSLPIEQNTEPVRIDFELDRATEPGEIETRELGLIAISVSLE